MNLASALNRRFYTDQDLLKYINKNISEHNTLERKDSSKAQFLSYQICPAVNNETSWTSCGLLNLCMYNYGILSIKEKKLN